MRKHRLQLYLVGRVWRCWRDFNFDIGDGVVQPALRNCEDIKFILGHKLFSKDIVFSVLHGPSIQVSNF